MSLYSFVLAKTAYVCLSIVAALLLMEVVRKDAPRVALAVACFLFIGFTFSLGLIDDAYISLRFARNYADGHGLVFNPGERVEGYTCFLWVWLLGLVRKINKAADLVNLAKYLGVAFGALTLILIYRFSRYLQGKSANREPTGRALVPSLLVLVAVNFPFVYWSYSGMETSFYLFLLVGSTYFFARYLTRRASGHRDLLYSSLLLVLAAMTRPETYLIAGCHFAFIAFRRFRGIRAAFRALGVFLLPFAVIFVPHFIWRYTYYGYLLPNTYYAKVGGGSLDLSLFGLGYLARGAVPHAILLAFIASKLVRKGHALRVLDHYLLALLVAWVLIVLHTGADHFSELRFFVFMLPFMYLFAFDEIERLVGWLGARASRLIGKGGPFLGRQVISALAIGSFLLVFYYNSLGITATVLCGRHLADKWGLLGQWMDYYSEPGDVVATPVVGAIGYYCSRPVVDMLGIVDSVIAHKPMAGSGEGPKDHSKFDTEYVLGRNPKYIHLLSTAPSEQLFLNRPDPIPAVEDLKRHFPNPSYKYVVVEIEGDRHALYVKK